MFHSPFPASRRSHDSTKHFYHWWGEIILGTWRAYSGIFRTKSPTPPLPARFLLPVRLTTLPVFNPVFVIDLVNQQHVHGREWRDRAGLNAPFMRACFPSTSIEISDYWGDLGVLDRTVVFDRAMIVSRETAHRQYVSFLLPPGSQFLMQKVDPPAHYRLGGSK